MRLLHVITALHTGGAERIMAQLSHEWAADHELHLAYLKPVRTLAPMFHPATRMHEIGLGRHTLADLRSLCRQVQPDVVHTHLMHADMLGQVAAKGLPTQRWITLHNAHFRTDARDILFQAAYRMLFAYMGRGIQAVAISEAVKQHAKQAWRLKSGQIHKVLNPLTAPKPRLERANARHQLGLTPNEPMFVFLGRLEPQKGLTYLFRALALLKAQGRQPKVYIVGEGSLAQSLKGEAERLALLEGNRLEFTGLSNEPGLYLSAADALVLPSLFEGLGNVVTEAFSFGIPVVASDLEGPAEIIQQGVTGFLVPPAQPQSLAEAMLRLMDAPSQAQTMGKAAAQVATGWPSYKQYAQQLIDLYENSAI